MPGFLIKSSEEFQPALHDPVLSNMHKIIVHGPSWLDLESFLERNHEQHVISHGPLPIYVVYGVYNKFAGARTTAHKRPNIAAKAYGGTPIVDFVWKGFAKAAHLIKYFHFLAFVSANRYTTSKAAIETMHLDHQKGAVLLASRKAPSTVERHALQFGELIFDFRGLAGEFLNTTHA